MKKNSPWIALLILLGLSGCPSSGNAWQSYRAVAVKQAIDRRMVIYIHFYQEGIPACEEQKDVLADILSDPKYKHRGAFRAEWNSDPKLQSALGIQKPCSLVSSIGSSVQASVTDEVDRAALQKVLDAALGR